MCDGLYGRFGAGRFSMFLCTPIQYIIAPVAALRETNISVSFSYTFLPSNISFTVELVVAALPDIYAERTLEFCTKQITVSHHIEFYLNWSTKLLTIHAAKENVFKHQSLLATQDALTRKYEALSKICDFNKYTLKVLIEMADAKEAAENGKKKPHGSDGNDDDDDDVDMNSDSDEDNLMLIRRTDDVDEKDEADDATASEAEMEDDSD